MGGSQSSRKLTVDNENAIQVSQEALDRIQTQLTSKVAEQAQPPQDYSNYAPPPPPLYDEKKSQKNAEEEAYWARRIENLKKAHETISQGMVQEYQRTLKETNELFEVVEKDEYTSKILPCQEEKAKVLECYTINVHQPLLCSSVVKDFNDCVCKSRLSAVSAS